MLGRKPRGAAAASSSREQSNGNAKKRKWQEEHSEDSGGEEKITKADLDAWKKTVEEEEKQEQLQRDREEREAKEAEKRRRESAEAERRRKQEDEARTLKDAEEARKCAEEAEAERRRQEAATAFIGAGPLPMDIPSQLPAGVRPGKEHLYKTSLCKRWEQGMCQFGAACHFAHGDREVRGKPPRGSPNGTMSVSAPDAMVKQMQLNRVNLPVLPVPPPAMVAGAGTLAPPLAAAPPGADQMQQLEAAAALSMLNSFLANAGVGPGDTAGIMGQGGANDASVPTPHVPRVVPPPVHPLPLEYPEYPEYPEYSEYPGYPG